MPKSNDTEIALIKQDISFIKDKQTEHSAILKDIAIKVNGVATEDYVREQIRLEAEKSSKLFVTKMENKPVQAFFKFFFGVISALVIAFLVAALNFILRGGLSK